MELVAKKWTAIADENQESPAARQQWSGRGAVAVLAAVRSAQYSNKMSKDAGAKLGVDNHRQYFNVENGNANLAPPPGGKEWYRSLACRLAMAVVRPKVIYPTDFIAAQSRTNARRLDQGRPMNQSGHASAD